ncbi:MAG: LPS export ABC transporter permease LptG [Oligoflexia bacterium]|nr:LPS export ABC transporter permease LptG [Oligoflexia bacterium]
MFLLSRYIISEFFVRFVFFLIVLMSLFVGIDILSKIWSINAPFSTMLYYYFLRLPGIAVEMVPVSTLLATLMFFSYMAKHNELVAFYCSGRSLIRVASPMFFIVMCISVFTFYFSDDILPVANFQAQKVWMVEILDRKHEFFGSLHHEKAWFRGNNLIYNVKSYDSKTRTISGINIYFVNRGFNLVQHISAKSAVFGEKDKWLLSDGVVTTFDGDRAYSKSFSEKKVMLEETPDDFRKVEASSDYLTTARLRDYIVELQNIGVDPSKYEVEYYKRYSLSFAGFIMSLIGLPFAIRQHRKGGVAFNIGIGFVLVFIYWIMFSVMLSLGVSGRIFPVISAWGANILFIIVAVFLVPRMQK